MTATYDGHLVVTKTGILPCCPDMHDALFLGVVYKGTTDRRPCAALRLAEKRGRAIRRCPFCGAEPEVGE